MYCQHLKIMEVERVTERLSDKNPCDSCKVDRQIGNPNRWECECSRCDKPNDWKNDCIKKLAEYETAEEEGRLVVLPSTQVYSSLGGYVYYIYDYEIAECVNCAITIDADGRMWICLAADEDIFPYREPIAEFDTDPTDWCKKTTDVLALEWGKTVFLTREEAEKELREMEGK